MAEKPSPFRDALASYCLLVILTFPVDCVIVPKINKESGKHPKTEEHSFPSFNIGPGLIIARILVLQKRRSNGPSAPGSKEAVMAIVPAEAAASPAPAPETDPSEDK